MKKKNKILENIKIVGLFAFFIFVLSRILFYGVDIHKVCPFSFICVGPLIIKHKMLFFNFGFFMGIIFLGLSLFHKNYFCNTICPIGTIQRFMIFLNKKIFKKKKFRIKLKEKTNFYLLIFKYFFNIIVLIIIFITGSMLFTKLCPIFFLGALSDKIFLIVPFIFFILLITVSFFLELAFCKYMCPFSSLSELIQIFFSFIKLKGHLVREEDLCINCKLCDKNCPKDIIISDSDKILLHTCIDCNKCVEICPINKKGDNTLYFSENKLIIFIKKIFKVNKNGK